MLTHCSHIAQKRGIYFYRRRLPLCPKSDMAISLRTRDFREAQYLSRLLDQAYEKVIEGIMGKPDLRVILKEYLKKMRDADLAQHLAAPLNRPVHSSKDLYPDPIDTDDYIIHDILADHKEALIKRDIELVRVDASELIKKHHLSEEQRVELSLGLIQARIQYLDTALKRVHEGIDNFMDLDSSPTDAPITSSGPHLSELLPDFLEFMKTKKGWKEQTLNQNKTTYRMFIEVVGDKPLQAYARKDLALFYDVLLKLPSLYSKKSEWKHLSLSEIVAKTDGMNVDRMTMKTVSRHFSALGSLFAYYKRRGEYNGENPAHGFEFPDKTKASSKRNMWEGEKLVKLFSSPVWSGCKSKGRRSASGNLVIKDEKYWLPMLGLYHGNRLEEFAQLRQEDIKQEDGIWFFNICDEGGRQTKNKQSNRRVPIHPFIISIGFLDYVNGVALLPDSLVFPNLNQGGPDQKLGYGFTKWWSRYRQVVGVYEKGLDYHSFRHGVTTKLYAAGVSEALVDEIIGHEGGGTSRRVYKKDMPISVLYDAIKKVGWKEVEELLL